MKLEELCKHYLEQGFEPIECEGFKVFHKYRDDYKEEFVVFCAEVGGRIFNYEKLVDVIDMPSLTAEATVAYERRKKKVNG